MIYQLEQYQVWLLSLFFIADLLTIGLFIRDLFNDGLAKSFGSALTQVTLIVLVFTFALFLWKFSTGNYKGFDIFLGLFGWVYVIFSAAILGIIAHRFIIVGNYSFGNFIGYLMFILLIAGLGVYLCISAGLKTVYFSIPYMLIALVQIILWVSKIISDQILIFDLTFVGNIMLFIYTSGIIMIFIRWPDIRGTLAK